MLKVAQLAWQHPLRLTGEAKFFWMPAISQKKSREARIWNSKVVVVQDTVSLLTWEKFPTAHWPIEIVMTVVKMFSKAPDTPEKKTVIVGFPWRKQIFLFSWEHINYFLVFFPIDNSVTTKLHPYQKIFSKIIHSFNTCKLSFYTMALLLVFAS